MRYHWSRWKKLISRCCRSSTGVIVCGCHSATCCKATLFLRLPSSFPFSFCFNVTSFLPPLSPLTAPAQTRPSECLFPNRANLAYNALTILFDIFKCDHFSHNHFIRRFRSLFKPAFLLIMPCHALLLPSFSSVGSVLVPNPSLPPFRCFPIAGTPALIRFS
jgi:hypothetical protein